MSIKILQIKKNLLLIIILIAVSFISDPAAVFAENGEIRMGVGAGDGPDSVVLCQLKNGDSAAFEFVINHPDGLDKEVPDDAEIRILCGMVHMHWNYIRLQKKAGRWVALYVPAASSHYTKKYNIETDIDENAVNTARFERKNDWVSLSINGNIVGAMPVKSKSETVQLELKDLGLCLRWTDRHFREERDEVELDVVGGCFNMSPGIYNLNDGDLLRFYFTPLEIHSHPQWTNSIAFLIDNSSIWLNHHDGMYSVEYDFADGRSATDRKLYRLKDGENTFDLLRQGDQIKVFLNGEIIKTFKHEADPVFGECWAVKRKVVGYKIKFHSAKLKSNTTLSKLDKNSWFNKVKRKNQPDYKFKILDSGNTSEPKLSPGLAKLNDGDDVRIYFQILDSHFSQEMQPGLGFDLDDDRFFIRRFFHVSTYLLDINNTANDEDFIPIPLNKGLNHVDFKRTGNKVKIFLNDKFVKFLLPHPDGGGADDWVISLRDYRLKVKYRVEKIR